MSQESVSSAVRSLYEKYPYPSRIPGGSADPFLDYLTAKSQNPQSGRRSFLDAGCGTGLNTLGGAAIYPHYDVFGCDLNRIAMEQIQNEAKDLGISNLQVQEQDLLNLDPSFGPERGFDVIYSTGVIHHTSDPVGILKSLASRLAPQGILRLMVYGELGRTGLYRFAEVAKRLFGQPEHEWASRVAQSKELLQELHQTTADKVPFMPPVFRGPWQDAMRVDDIEFADRYLNPHDQPFTIETLKAALQDADLHLLDWFEPREWDLKQLLPQFAASPACPQDDWSRYELVERLYDRPKLDLYLVKKDFQPRQLDLSPTTYLGLNPQLFLSCLKVRGTSFHRSAQLRLGPEEQLDRDEGLFLENLGLKFASLTDVLMSLPNPTLDHWMPVVQRLVERDFLFSPHVDPASLPVS